MWTWRCGEGVKRNDLVRLSGRFCGFRPLLASIYQTLLRWHLVFWVQRINPGKKYAFWRIQRQPALLKPPSGCWWNSDFGGLASIFSRLDFTGFLYPKHFAGKSPGYTSLKSGSPMSVHRCGMGPASASTYQQRLPVILLPPRSHH